MVDIHSNIIRGVCGNFRFKILDVTNVATTNSVIPADMVVQFACGATTTQTANHIIVSKLNWTGTGVTDTANRIDTNGNETFVPQIHRLIAYNTESSDTDEGKSVVINYDVGNTDQLICYAVGDGTTLVDYWQTGDEDFQIQDEHHILLDSQSSADDGKIILIGK